MPFVSYNSLNLARFNSDTSSHLLEDYEKYWENDIKRQAEGKPHQTIAPSSFRCRRKIWFRLRGSEPDIVRVPDKALDFTAQIGTACHRLIQQNLKDMLKKDWISVRDFLAENPIPYSYHLTEDETSLETKVQIPELKVSFSCDGIFRYEDKIWLLEIKTSEYNSFKNMHQPKEEHVDQVICYSALLGIPNVMFIYQERLYGELKVYERIVNDYEKRKALTVIKDLIDASTKNLPPERLNWSDKWCNQCPYSIKCKQWG